MEEEDAVADFLDVAHVMGGVEDGGGAFLLVASDELADLVGDVGVEGGGGFVSSRYQAARLLDIRWNWWEIPTMAETRKLDSRRRAVFPDRFSPGDLFIEERVEEDRVVFRLVKPEEVPVSKVRREKGRVMVKAPLDRERVRQAVRDDRDSR